MSYVILGFALLALFHFIYEGILAPSFRMKLRFDLCALRDELNRLKRDSGAAFDDERFCHLHDSLTALIATLHRFDVSTLLAVSQEIGRNPELREKVERRERMLDTCGVPELRDLRRRSLVIATRALAVNHGGWCIYGIPMVLGYLSLRKMGALIRATASLSKPDLFRIAPVVSPGR